MMDELIQRQNTVPMTETDICYDICASVEDLLLH